jgi:Protein of unknown function (DUF1501)
MDTWDPKPSSPFRPISTNVPIIQISELLPRMAKRMDKLAIIRSIYTEENNHPQASYYAFTRQAQSMILSSAVRDAFNLYKEPEKIKAAYGRNGFGQSVLLAHRLAEAAAENRHAASPIGPRFPPHLLVADPRAQATSP